MPTKKAVKIIFGIFALGALALVVIGATEAIAFFRANLHYAQQIAIEEFDRYALLWHLNPSDFDAPKAICSNDSRKFYQFDFIQHSTREVYSVRVTFLPLEANVGPGPWASKC